MKSEVSQPDNNNINTHFNVFFSLHTGERMKRDVTGRACSPPEAEVIDGVETTAPSAQWPLLAQMVCDLTNRGH